MSNEQKLREALQRLYIAAPTSLECKDFHHSKREQHGYDEECGPAQEYLAALKQAAEALVIPTAWPAVPQGEPISTIKYWAEAYADAASGPHFQGHGMVAHLLREYAQLREALAGPTGAPVGEREAFEKWITKNGEWPNNAIRSCRDPDRYANFDIQGLWGAWQARAALSDGDVVDAQRYRWLRDIAPTIGNRAPHVTQYPGQSFDTATYLDAVKVGLDAAIDAAMRKAQS